MTPEVIEVWIAERGVDRRVGLLRPSFMRGRTLASSSFEYDEAWMRDGWAISPDLPLERSRIYTAENQTLPGTFSDTVPDDWGQKLIRADHARRRRQDDSLPPRSGEFDYLLGVADRTRVGALRLRVGGSWLSDESGVANVHDLQRILDVAQRYDDDEASDDDIAYLNEVATSPGGARPKANVVLDDRSLAIAKLPHSKDGRFDVERWEAVALTLAADSGLVTPRWSVEASPSGRAVLLSMRFDRDPSGGRFAYMSGRTALRLGLHDDGASETYEDFADAIAEWSAAPVVDLHEMFGRIALTVLINNVDDHWRNHAFLRLGQGWRLSPVFDINPSRQRGVIDSRAISDDDDPSDRRLEHLLEVASTFQLSDAAARRVITRVAVAVSNWETVATRLGLDEWQRAGYRDAFSSPQLAWALSLDADLR